MPMDLQLATTERVGSSRLTLMLVAGVTVLGGFLFGYDTAVINGANQYLARYFSLTPFQEGLAGASAILGCMPGALVAGALSDRFGRRRILFVSAILFATSAILSAIPRSFTEFLVARVIGGLGIGATSMVCPVFIAELSPPKLRGTLGALFQLGIVVGIFVTLFVNAAIQSLGDEAWNTASGWRWMLGSEVLPAGVLLLLLFGVPESPRWLSKTGKIDAAKRVLSKLSGGEQADHIVHDMLVAERADEAGYAALLRPRYRRPLLIAVVLMAISQLSGINVVMYYSTQIFTSAGAGISDAFASSVFVGLVNLVATGVALAGVDLVGRKPLLLFGLAVQVVALASTAWMFASGAGGLPLLLAIVSYIAAFAMALGPIPWILCSELFPTSVRGAAMSVATMTIWSACYLVIQTFPWLNASPAVGPATLFYVYCGFSLCGFAFVTWLVPETKGKSLEEIGELWDAVTTT